MLQKFKDFILCFGECFRTNLPAKFTSQSYIAQLLRDTNDRRVAFFFGDATLLLVSETNLVRIQF